MKILTVISPGRFPTVVLDTGPWWDAIAAGGQHDLHRFSANFYWWRVICSARFKELMLKPLGRFAQFRQLAQWRADKLVLDGTAASAALKALTTPQAFETASTYFETIGPISRFFEEINLAQCEFDVSVGVGPRVSNVDYNDSAALLRYVQNDSLLSRSIDATFENCKDGFDLALLSVTCPEDLLTTMICAKIIRARNPGIHISLIDHGYENFSLHSKIPELHRTGALERVFDAIIASKDDRDDIVPALVDAISRNDKPHGILTRARLPPLAHGESIIDRPPPISPTFIAEPVFGMRLSKRRCYWSRCTFCTQNSKYDNPRAPARSEILESLSRIQASIENGYRYFYFTDEAISPSTLRMLAEEIEARGIRMRWACRCKLERAYTPELFERLGRSGCYEILFGLETTSARVLKLMDKYVEGLDEAWIGRMFQAMEQAGIGIHANLIGAFPGDTLDETEHSVEFLIREFSQLRGGTYLLNKFSLVADSPVATNPMQFGVATVVPSGDIAQSYEYELVPQIAAQTDEVARAIPQLRKRLDTELGWADLFSDPAKQTAVELYFLSGHGSIFKSRPNNPFGNPLLESALQQA